ncbi:FAD-dependent monooxygenase [Kitasatospora sp. NPDC051914]|uniref:FAD-dependent monooxygenase n=1 Tax=Kitasatospora sp. NPDC051914 TaxID=3154945 RepID=UPI00341927FF
MKVVVVGAGVAGAAVAVALRRIGAEVTVHEAYEDPAGPVGSFVSLAVNGLRGLDALGCLDEVRAAGFPVARQRMWAGDTGRLLGDVPRGRAADDPLHSVTLMRADLVGVLRTAAGRAGARIVTGHRPAPADPDLADADLVIGADGIRSATRRGLDPSAPEPAYAGLYSVSGVSDGVHGDPGTFNMTFAKCGVFIHLPAPDGTTWWSAQVAAPRAPDLAAVGIAELSGLYRTEQRPLDVLRAAQRIDAATLHHVLAPVPRRHDDRTVLIGDAAHPVGAGQGASMAIEDAVVLARELHRAATVPAALAAYDGLRDRRIGRMAKAASANRDAKTAGPVTARLRNLVMPFVFPRFYPRATGWLYDYEPGGLPAGR